MNVPHPRAVLFFAGQLDIPLCPATAPAAVRHLWRAEKELVDARPLTLAYLDSAFTRQKGVFEDRKEVKNETLLLPHACYPPRHGKNFTLECRPRYTETLQPKSRQEAGAACARASAQSPIPPTCAAPIGGARPVGWRESAREAPGWLSVWGREDRRRLERATLGDNGGIFMLH